MAFNPGATDYGGMLDLRRMSDKQVTQALDAKGRADKRSRIKKSGERSGLQKLGSAAVRGAAAYFSGGASEAMGFGGAIDDVMLGTDSEGGKIRNEYGDLVKTGSAVYGSMKAKKAGDVAAKRASNLQDYEQKVKLGKEMGLLDKKQGMDMLLSAEDLRSRQQTQTQAGEDAGVFGWKGEFDDLEMTPAQKAGKEQADLKVAPEFGGDPLLQTIDSGGVTPDVTPDKAEDISDVLGDRTMRDRINKKFPEHQAELDKVEALWNKDREAADLFNTREDAMGAKRGYKTDAAVDKQLAEFEKGMSVGKIDEDREWDRLSKQMDTEDMMDQEYNKKLASVRTNRSDTPNINEATLLPYAEYEADHEGRKANLLAGRGYGYKPGVNKTYSEKEAEAMSSKDTDKKMSTLDQIAFDTKGKALEERGGFLRGYDRLLDPKQGKEDAQHWAEFQRQQKAALAREHERTGGPDFPKDISGTKRYKSPLRKRMEKRQQRAKEVALKRGGVLAGSPAQ